MRTRIRPFVLFGLLLGGVACRGATEDAAAGTWVMHLDGAPFMVLTLERSDDRLDGTFSHPARMSTDGLTFSGIGGEVVTTRVRGTIHSDAEVTLVTEDADGRAGGTPMELTIVSPDEASLTPAGALFEPWRFTRHRGAGRPEVGTGWDSTRSYAIREVTAPPNAEMAAIYAEDQADRQSPDAFQADAERIARADAARRARTRALLDAGALEAGEDFRLAAQVFQHGSDPADYLFAHALAMTALARGDRSASWIAAATLDRYLQAIGQPQVFGTQFSWDGRQDPYDPALVPDAIRRDLGVPAVAVQQEQMQMLLELMRQRAAAPPVQE